MIFHCNVSYQKKRLLENTIFPAQNINPAGKQSNLQLASSNFTTALLSSIWVLWKQAWSCLSLTIWRRGGGGKGPFVSNSSLLMKFFTHSKLSTSVIYLAKNAEREGLSEFWVTGKLSKQDLAFMKKQSQRNKKSLKVCLRMWIFNSNSK